MCNSDWGGGKNGGSEGRCCIIITIGKSYIGNGYKGGMSMIY